MTPSYDTFRLQNDDIRPGSSPQDLSAVVRTAGAAVTVPFKIGTKVYFIDMVEATVADDGNGNSVVDVSAATDKAMICAAAIHMQI